MATFNLTVPNRKLAPLANGDKTIKNSQVETFVSTGISSLKKQYSSIVDEVASNSNVPKELLYSMILVLSNGQNNTQFKSVDKLVRKGLFSLSNKTSKAILSREVATKRLSEAEKSYLSKHDPVIASYLGEKGTKATNKHWSSDFTTGEYHISDTVNPFDLMKPEVSIQLGAIWLGQMWDKISEYTRKPEDKVIIAMALPYGMLNQNGVLNVNNPYVSGNGWVKGLFNVNFSDPENIQKIPAPSSATASSNIINPNGGSVTEALKIIFAPNGTLDLLTR
jgi:hypothetical protein